jgi:hypothetical protein
MRKYAKVYEEGKKARLFKQKRECTRYSESGERWHSFMRGWDDMDAILTKKQQTAPIVEGIISSLIKEGTPVKAN